MRWAPGRVLWVSAALLLATSMLALGLLQRWYLREFVLVFFAQIGLYGAAAWAVLRGRGAPAAAGLPALAPVAAVRATRHERWALLGVLLVAAALRCIALAAPQALSTDAFRYVWDGRVQLAGVNPYRYIPADPALKPLRDTRIYPSINRASYAHTIYPPAAQLVFLAAARVSDSITGMKLAMLFFDGIAIAALIALLRSLGLPGTRVLLYAWHPLPLWEFAGTGHVDAVAIALLLLALLCAQRRSPAWAGIALAAATLVKYYPATIAPALYRRWDWRLPLAFAATVGVLYLPYLGVGKEVFGFLPGYAAEEGLRDGSGVFLWSAAHALLQLPGAGLLYVYVPLAMLGLFMLSLRVVAVNGTDPTHRADLSHALLLLSVFTVCVSPHDPWYFTALVPFLCFRFSFAHLWLTAACVLLYVLPEPTGVRAQALIYVPFLLLLLVQAQSRRQSAPLEIADVNRSHR